MTAEEKKRIIEKEQNEAESAKMRLISIADKLQEAGCIRQFKSLQTIICQLEDWQNK